MTVQIIRPRTRIAFSYFSISTYSFGLCAMNGSPGPNRMTLVSGSFSARMDASVKKLIPVVCHEGVPGRRLDRAPVVLRREGDPDVAVRSGLRLCCGFLRLFQNRRPVKIRCETDIHPDHAPVGNHIGRDASLDPRDDRRRPAEQCVLMLRDEGPDLIRRPQPEFHGAPPLPGVGAVARLSGNVEPEPQTSFLRGARLKSGRLADQDPSASGHPLLFKEGSGAYSVLLLVACTAEKNRMPERPSEPYRFAQGEHHRAEAALHIAGSAPVDPPPGDGRNRRIRPPLRGRAVRHRIQMAVPDHSLSVRNVSDPGRDVRVRPVDPDGPRVDPGPPHIVREKLCHCALVVPAVHAPDRENLHQQLYRLCAHPCFLLSKPSVSGLQRRPARSERGQTEPAPGCLYTGFPRGSAFPPPFCPSVPPAA